jgi:hypothetical protein
LRKNILILLMRIYQYSSLTFCRNIALLS